MPIFREAAAALPQSWTQHVRRVKCKSNFISKLLVNITGSIPFELSHKESTNANACKRESKSDIISTLSQRLREATVVRVAPWAARAIGIFQLSAICNLWHSQCRLGPSARSRIVTVYPASSRNCLYKRVKQQKNQRQKKKNNIINT